ncbi:MAG TPA: hypothetical protein ENO12_02960 [Thermoplasmatales archaeon]|nr:hypothetical protein [Thermoplasmatales archaeon]
MSLTGPQDDIEIVQVAHDIERYLLSHPQAADTLEGIARWWLQQQRFIDSLDRVYDALEILIERGMVKKITNADGKNIYRCSCSYNSAC